jgi:recombination protein RecA
VKVVKNKVAAPFRQAEFDIMYSQGISREGSLLDIGVDLGLVNKSGAWYTYEGEQLGQGREKAKEFLSDNPEVMVEISERILQQVGLDGSEEEHADGLVELDDLDLDLVDESKDKGKDKVKASSSKAKGKGKDNELDPDDLPISLD